MKKVKALFVLGLILLSGCYYDKYNDLYPTVKLGGCDTTNVTFSTQVNKAMTSYCIGCHNGSTASGGVVLDNYTGVKTQVDNGRLTGAIKHQSGYKPMPPTGQIDACRIKMIEKWIAAGAPNN